MEQAAQDNILLQIRQSRARAPFNIVLDIKAPRKIDAGPWIMWLKVVLMSEIPFGLGNYRSLNEMIYLGAIFSDRTVSIFIANCT